MFYTYVTWVTERVEKANKQIRVSNEFVNKMNGEIMVYRENDCGTGMSVPVLQNSTQTIFLNLKHEHNILLHKMLNTLIENQNKITKL